MMILRVGHLYKVISNKHRLISSGFTAKKLPDTEYVRGDVALFCCSLDGLNK